jgi:hypothetical protein
MSEDCEVCKMLTEYFLKNNPERKGYAMCEKCISDAGIVPIQLLYDPYESSEPPK